MGGSGRAGESGAARLGRDGLQTERVASGRFRWQLKAPNGRVVAVSSPVYESAAEAERAFTELAAAGPTLVARITHVREGIGWIWALPGVRGNPVARSSRAYERYATCQNAFRRFVALLAKPDLPAGPGLPR